MLSVLVGYNMPELLLLYELGVNLPYNKRKVGEYMLDTFEKLILRVLQRNGRASTQELSDAVGLSPSPCWRRVKRLEDDGLILF